MAHDNGSGNQQHFPKQTFQFPTLTAVMVSVLASMLQHSVPVLPGTVFPRGTRDARFNRSFNLVTSLLHAGTNYA